MVRELLMFPQDMLVLRDWEGELVTPNLPRIANCHRFCGQESASEDYYPECTAEDEDYVQFKAVVLE